MVLTHKPGFLGATQMLFMFLSWDQNKLPPCSHIQTRPFWKCYQEEKWWLSTDTQDNPWLLNYCPCTALHLNIILEATFTPSLAIHLFYNSGGNLGRFVPILSPIFQGSFPCHSPATMLKQAPVSLKRHLFFLVGKEKGKSCYRQGRIFKRERCYCGFSWKVECCWDSII